MATERPQIRFKSLLILTGVLAFLTVLIGYKHITEILIAFLIFTVGYWTGYLSRGKEVETKIEVVTTHSTDGFASNQFEFCQAHDLFDEETTLGLDIQGSPQEVHHRIDLG